MRCCPKCKSSEYNNRWFVLMVNECGHSLCKNCVDLLFARGSAECPQCKRTLKKVGFWEQTFDDPLVEKEVFFRKKLQKVFNLREEDFSSLRAYNDYLEEYESLVTNLTQDVDVDATWKKVEQFRKGHEEQITKNRSKKTADQLWIEQMIDEDNRFKGRIKAYQQETEKAAGGGRGFSEAKAVIEELQKSNQPAAFIVLNKQREQTEKEPSTLYTGPQGESAKYFDEPKVFHVSTYSAEKYVYEPVSMEVNGPGVPEVFELDSAGYLRNIRKATPDQTAGGYHESYGCIRALTEARLDLFVC